MLWVLIRSTSEVLLISTHNICFHGEIRKISLLLEIYQVYQITFTSFKYQINKYIQKPTRYFTVGARFAQIQHTHLRTSCSSLNHRLFSKNIINDLYDLCQCGSV